MSKGTTRFALRIPDVLKDEMATVVQRRNDSVTSSPPWSMTDFVRVAIMEKLAKMQRSKKGSKRYETGATHEWTTGQHGRVEVPGTLDDFDSGFYAEAEDL